VTQTRRIATPGAALSVEIRGAGSSVVLLHGFTGSARSMEGVARGLSGTHRTLAFDLVGHGRSDAPADPAAYALPRCLEQLSAALDALGIARAHWLGYSLGGRVALCFCAAHPERVRSALLVGASAGLADPAARAARAREDEALARQIEREGLPAFVERWMAQPLLASQARLGAAFLARAREERLSQRAHGLAGALRGLGTGSMPPLQARLASLRVPVCLVAGAEDAKFTALAAELAAQLPDARAELVPGAGHAAHLESEEVFLALARRFFAEVEAREASRSPLPGPCAGAHPRTPCP
jgi:2-succinyl-6-hydroxy-2,4-cyclohexadiene-1-carboxylate synthase